jgi:hypothetical protein
MHWLSHVIAWALLQIARRDRKAAAVLQDPTTSRRCWTV